MRMLLGSHSPRHLSGFLLAAGWAWRWTGDSWWHVGKARRHPLFLVYSLATILFWFFLLVLEGEEQGDLGLAGKL